jgi:chromate transporter
MTTTTSIPEGRIGELIRYFLRLGWKVSNPLLIAATAVVGLIAFPLLQPAWVLTKF